MSRAFKLLRQLAQDAKNNPGVIIASRHGYRAWGRYDITVSSSGSVTVRADGGAAEEFSDLRCAVMWCQFMAGLDLARAISVLTLDQELGRVQQELEYRQQREAQGRGSELNDIKLSELGYRRDNLQQQIAKYVAIAKYKQLKGSDPDETHRTKS